MPRRYCITYVGGDSYTHQAKIWAKDHHEALKKFRARYRHVDLISSVHRASNLQLYLWCLVAVVALGALVRIFR